VEIIIQLVFQLLIVLSDIKNSKFWILSLRSGSFFFMLGMSFILMFLGLFSIWMIAFVGICGYLQINMFINGLSMSNDSSAWQQPIEGGSLMERLIRKD
jgi:hypothetical protein